MTAVTFMGVQIAGEFWPEAKVFASLLKHRFAEMEVRVVHHSWQNDRQSADRSRWQSDAPLVICDSGWRPWASGGFMRYIRKLEGQLHVPFAYRAMKRAALELGPSAPARDFGCLLDGIPLWTRGPAPRLRVAGLLRT
jgi:hypothetical protein